MENIVGFIGDITTKFVYGWAMDKNAPEVPVKVSLMIDQDIIQTTEANLLRRDIQEKAIHPTGYCGFNFKLSEPIYDTKTLKVIIANTQIELPKSGNLIRLEKKKEQTPRGPYFFIHIPKTAGTSFRNMLYRQFEQGAIYPGNRAINEDASIYHDWGKIESLTPEESEKINLLTGHFPYAAHKIFGSGCKTLTMLRDPVKRVCSLLAHMKRHTPAYEELTFEAIFAVEPQATNGMLRLFIKNYSKDTLDEQDLEEGKKNLEQCSLVGLSEHFELSVKLAEKKFDWELGEHVRTNVGNKYKNKFSRDLIKLIQKANQLDIAFYAFAEEIFAKQLSSEQLVFQD